MKFHSALLVTRGNRTLQEAVAGQGLRLWIVSCSEKSRLRKSRCEITFKVFPPPNQKDTAQPTGAISPPHSSCREAERTQNSSVRPAVMTALLLASTRGQGGASRGLCVPLNLSWGLSQDLLACRPTSDTPESEGAMTGPGSEKEEAETSSRTWCPWDSLEGPGLTLSAATPSM